jgi:uncharacterized repeat protein (TIGR01451 family)
MSFVVAGRFRALAVAVATAAALVPAALAVGASAPALAQTGTAPQGGASTSLYFAEGNTLPGWFEFITILNPSTSDTATVTINYACEQPAGTKVSCGIAGDTVTRTIPPLSRDTVSVSDPTQGGVNGTFTGVGATLRANLPIVAERPMYMEQPQGAFSQIPAVVSGAHDARAQTPGTLWYLPEGTTQPDFQDYLTILNPNTATVTADITYSIEGGTVVHRTRALEPNSRTTVDVVDPTSPGSLGQQVIGLSTIVTAPDPIVVERPLYFNHDFGGGVGLVNGATDKPGAKRAVATANPNSGTSLTFAEGNGLPDFEQYFTVLNTENRAGTVTINYLVEGQTTPVVRTCPIGALARLTIDASQTGQNPCSLGRENAGTTVAKGVGASMSADVAIAAERPMYFVRSFPEIGTTNGAHDVFGVVSPDEAASEYYFAEGSTRTGFDQFWTIANPNNNQITVGIDYLYQPGAAGKSQNETITYTVAANSRLTIQVFNTADAGVGRNGDAGYDFGAHAFSTDGSIFGIERPFYTRRAIGNGTTSIVTDDGHDIPGAPPSEVFGTQLPRLALQKQGPSASLSGNEITYTLTLTNTGTTVSPATFLVDQLPSGSSYIRSTGGQLITENITPTVVFAVGDLTPGITITDQVVITATAGDAMTATTTTITNTAAAASVLGEPEVTANATTTVITPGPVLAVLTSTMTGANQTPTAGSSTGTGDSTITVYANVVFYTISTSGVTDTVVAGHIHQGAAGTNGPVVIPFNDPPPVANGTVSGFTPVSSTLSGQLVSNPNGFYTNIHTTTFPAGSFRGQLNTAGP